MKSIDLPGRAIDRFQVVEIAIHRGQLFIVGGSPHDWPGHLRFRKPPGKVSIGTVPPPGSVPVLKKSMNSAWV